jgi:UDP-N-acetylglucosamine--N-acetylmuramyl-(pentapeptide) pyrophosphoryl-undecaprenol N-acetylglucosamine transferase
MSAAPILILAGGTGGHVFPALAVADELRRLGASVHWLGAAGRLESKVAAERGIPFAGIAVAGLRGRGLIRWLAAPWHLARALVQALRILRDVAPRVALGFGGFAAGPGAIAARLLGVPLLIHEQNRAPGLTNRVLARFARRVLCGFPDAFPTSRGAEWTGNPVREEIAALPPPETRLAGRSGRRRLLVLGGSQGAAALNRLVPAALARIAPAQRPEVIHQCGPAHLPETAQAYSGAGVEARVEAFLEDMAEAYGWADLVLARAGASTLAEITAAGLASILVPFPYAVDDHQTRNAEFLVERGAAVRIAEAELDPDGLAGWFTTLLGDDRRRLSMAMAARALARPDAAHRVALACLEEAR